MIKGCGVQQFSDQMFCKKCGVLFDVNDPAPPPCGLAFAEFIGFYVPIVLLAALAAWLLSPTLAALVAFGLVCYAGADVSARGQLG